MEPEEQDRLREKHKREQNNQEAVEQLPLLYWGLYQRYKQVGFTEEQAFRMVLAMIAGSLKA